MARTRKPPRRSPSPSPAVPLARPPEDRRDDHPIDAQTLYRLAEQRQLLRHGAPSSRVKVVRAAADGTVEDDEDEEAAETETEAAAGPAERVFEALLWTGSLAMLHFTFDVLVQHQYGTQVIWDQVVRRAISAWAVFALLFWTLHPSDRHHVILPGLPPRAQPVLGQLIFFAMSVLAGCALVRVTTTAGYLATQKRAPPLGCLWIWAVIELDLVWAALSLLLVGAILKLTGYSII